MVKIAIYGKGGIGKSTTASNLSASLAQRGLCVMQIGCDPKADSTQMLCGREHMPTVLDVIREKGSDVGLDDIVVRGKSGVYCVEAGGPTPGIGCVGRGIITAFDCLEKLNAYETFCPDVVLYDVLGDVVCGGFAMPLRGGYADHVFVVTSGEKMSLYAAANIAAAVEGFRDRGYARLSGLIFNERRIPNEEETVAAFAQEHDTRVIQKIPRHDDVQRAEERGTTVVEAFPESTVTIAYRSLAERILDICSEEDSI